MRPINKIFQIGFNKCGTSSLCRLFETSSLPRVSSIHWHEGRLAYTMRQNMRCGLPLLSSYEHITFFSDMECLYVEPGSNKVKLLFAHVDFFELLDQHYPGSKFILNTRPLDSWLASRLKHMVGWGPVENGCVGRMKTKKSYEQFHMEVFDLSSREAVVEKWKADWHRHHRRVQQHFADRTQDLLVYDIERDPLAKLKKFFAPYGLLFTAEELPRENKTLIPAA